MEHDNKEIAREAEREQMKKGLFVHLSIGSTDILKEEFGIPRMHPDVTENLETSFSLENGKIICTRVISFDKAAMNKPTTFSLDIKETLESRLQNEWNNPKTAYGSRYKIDVDVTLITSTEKAEESYSFMIKAKVYDYRLPKYPSSPEAGIE